METEAFLKKVPLPILITLAAVLIIITIFMLVQYVRLKGLAGVRNDVYRLVLQAEHRYRESGQGQQKLTWVVRQTRDLLPKWVRIFVSEETLANLIQQWFYGIKDLLDDGKVNGSQTQK